MDSPEELAAIYERLAMQVDLGIDEWITDSPISRFEEPASKAEIPAKISPQIVPSKPEQVATVDLGAVFATISTLEALRDATLDALPPALGDAIRNSGENAVPNLGDPQAEFMVLVDTPTREASNAGDLRANPAINLLIKSLAAIGIGIDGTDHARAQALIVPILPWRIPQGRRATEDEAKVLGAAIKRFMALHNFRGVLFAGGDLAGLTPDSNGQFGGVIARALVSPRAMVREPLLKRRHWQILRSLYEEMDEILKI